MNIYLKSLLSSLLVIASVTSRAESASLAAAHEVSPEQYQLLTENDEVLVLQMLLKPGEADVQHAHRNETVYFEKGGLLRIAEVGGNTFDVNVPDGHVMWHEAWGHQVTNVGETTVKAIIVESKN